MSLGNLVWLDGNNNGLIDNGESGLPNVSVRLYLDTDNNNQPDGDPISTATTDGAGLYIFNNLGIGNYIVEIVPPAGYNSSTGGGTEPASDADDNILDNDDNGTTFDTGNGMVIRALAVTLNPGSEPGAEAPNNAAAGDLDANLTVDFGLWQPIYRDYGDLPDTDTTGFPTNGNDSGEGSGASHVINDTLYLGTCVDAEEFGAPTDRAGLASTGGDDNTAGLASGSAGTCANADDEDGVTLITPMLPDTEACVAVTAVNQTGAPAILQGWIDFNGDGRFTGDEALTTGSFTGGGVPIPAGGVNGQPYCFTTPASATFEGGETHARWRLSRSGGLAPHGDAPEGEVEDYWQPLACLGNRVWMDWNENGIQDTANPDEPGIANMRVSLVWYGGNGTYESTGSTPQGDDRIYHTVTDAVGAYHFCGLLPSDGNSNGGRYEVQLIEPYVPIATQRVDAANDDVDSNIINDGVYTTLMRTDPVTIPTPQADAPTPFTLPSNEAGPLDSSNPILPFPDSSVDLTIDLGIDPHDMGDLPDANGGAGNFPTTLTDGGEGAAPFHTIQSDLYLGDCVDPEVDGQPDSVAGTSGAGGDDGNQGFVTRGACTNLDDEDGIQFVTPMVPGGPACVAVTANVPGGEQGILQGWIDFNGDGDFGVPGGAVDANELLSTRDFANGRLTLSGPVAAQRYCFDVPIDATTLAGNVYMRFRLSNDGLTPDDAAPLSYYGPADTGEMEDYMLVPPPYCVGNYIWIDSGTSAHVQDSADVPAAGLAVNLIWGGPDEDVSTVGDNFTYPGITDASGRYHFCGLLPDPDGDAIPDQYQVVVPSRPDGTIALAAADQGGNDSLDSDGVAGTNNAAESVPFTVTDDGANRDQAPNDASGLENGIPDIRDDLTIDFGFFAPASLGDLVWFDDNRDGIQDAVETGWPDSPHKKGVPGVLVSLHTADGALAATTTTDTSGFYHFGQLAPGSYYVQFTVPNGYEVTLTDVAAATDLYDSDAPLSTLRTPDVTLVAGEHNPTLDLGLYLSGNLAPASIGDYVWYDANVDGIQDGNETGVSGVAVTLYDDSNTVIARTKTDATGFYEFNSLPPGDYYLIFTTPPGYQISPQNSGSDDGLDSDVNPANGRTETTTLSVGEDDPSWDLGLSLNTPPATIGNYVWFDRNVNGLQDGDETGVPGVSVTLYREDNTVVATLETDANGAYLFTNLAPGNYYLHFATPSGYTPTVADAGDDALDSDANVATGRTVVTTLDAGEVDLTWDYGLWHQVTGEAAPVAPAGVGDYVWFDTNNNGIQESNERPASGITVMLYDSLGELIAIDVTDASGHYAFLNLIPGDYFVEFVAPDGYSTSPLGTNPADNLDSNADPNTGRTPIITLTTGEYDPNWDSGFYRPPTSLGDEPEPTANRLYLPIISRLRIKLLRELGIYVPVIECSSSGCFSR